MPRNTARLPAKMAARNNEIRPVGAWVQPESRIVHPSFEAVLSAEYEDKRIKQEQDMKQQKLQNFQNQVRKRVSDIEKVKRQQQLHKSYKAVEVERNVLQQSVRAAEKNAARKNKCTIRDESDLAIRHSACVKKHGGENAINSVEDPAATNVYQDQASQMQQYHRHARRNLMARRVTTADLISDDLPGGVWKSESQMNQQQHDMDGIAVDEDQGTQDELIQPVPNMLGVHMEGDSTSAQASVSVPDLYPDQAMEEEKQRAVSQRAMYRRLFMDIEREQVKENLRHKEHRRKISRLKQEKEEQRRQQEELSHEAVEPRDPVTGESLMELRKREVATERSMRQANEKLRARSAKHKETNRFLEALKASVREKVEKQGVDIPPLCCCGTTVWDTNLDNCANNCIYYKNPDAYAKALQSLLSSCDVL